MQSDLQLHCDATAELVWGGTVAACGREHPDAGRIRSDIAEALARHAQREAGRIAIDVEGGVVTLHGRVDSLAGHDAVMGTAFAARGVTRVVDRLEVTG